MRIIELAPQSNGAHRNQTCSEPITPHEGWAIIPEEMVIPDTFPFVNVDAEDGVVTYMAPGEVSPPDPEPEPEPMYSPADMIQALLDAR